MGSTVNPSKEDIMFLHFLKSKLHRIRATHSELDYEGSCAIDEEFLEGAAISINEQIHIYNINNGERFSTYAIPAPRGSKIISVNGAAAHKVKVGDLLIICSYCMLSEEEAKSHKPKLVYFDGKNNFKQLASVIQNQSIPENLNHSLS